MSDPSPLLLRETSRQPNSSDFASTGNPSHGRHTITDSKCSATRAKVHTVAVIGAGLGGIATCVNLKKRGIDDFVVLERADGPGGTWWHNRYPGCEVDVTSELYSFSFKDHVFSRSHVRQPELLRYIEQVVDEHDIRRHCRFGVAVKELAWDSSNSAWELALDDGTTVRARFVVSAVGMLSDPRWPDWPGMEDFSGQRFHTSSWPEGIDLSGKRVAVIGTGSTGAQIVPTIAPQVKHLYLFQRQPGWVLPKPDYDYPPAEFNRLNSSSLLRRYRRLREFLRIEGAKAAAKEGTKQNIRLKRQAEDYLQSAISDPQKRAAALPDYPFGRKRPVLSKDFLPAVDRDNVSLVPRAVDRLTSNGVVDSAGTETPVDVIVIATGFNAEHFLSTIEVLGCDGRSLRETWGPDPKAFLGLMVPGFPNFFMLYGPNTNGGDVLFTLERQAEWIARTVRRAVQRRLATVDVKQWLLELADRIIERNTRKFAWASGTNNYYTSETGRVVTQWPFTQTAYWLLLLLFNARWFCTTTRHATAREQALATSEVS